MPTPDFRLASLRRLAGPLAALSFVVMAFSVYLRLDYAGIGCEDWPACYGQALADPATRPAIGVARVLHRLTATIALILTIIITYRALRPVPLWPVARYACLLLALQLVLSAIGIVSDDSHRVWVNFLNILGGLGLVSFCCRVYLATCPPPLTASILSLHHGLMRGGLACLTATILLGCLIGARYAATACTSLPACAGQWWPTADVWPALNPFAVLPLASPVIDAGTVALHLLHRLLALTTLLLLATACLGGLRQPETRPGSLSILVSLCATFSLGIATVASGFPLWLTLGHGLAAAATLVTIARHQVASRQHGLSGR